MQFSLMCKAGVDFPQNISPIWHLPHSVPLPLPLVPKAARGRRQWAGTHFTIPTVLSSVSLSSAVFLFFFFLEKAENRHSLSNHWQFLHGVFERILSLVPENGNHSNG